MFKFFFSLFSSSMFTCFLNAQENAPYFQNFDSYNSSSAPTDWVHSTSRFQIYPARGVNATQCMTREFSSLSQTDSVISPSVFCANAGSYLLSVDCRIVQYVGTTPLAYNLAVGEQVEFTLYKNNFSASTILAVINSSNQVASATYSTLQIPLPVINAGDSVRIQAKAKSTTGDFFLEIDNFNFSVSSAIFSINQVSFSCLQTNDKMLYLNFPQAIKSVSNIIGANGQVEMQVEKFNSAQVKFDLNTLPSGIYFIEVFSGKKKTIRKIRI